MLEKMSVRVYVGKRSIGRKERLSLRMRVRIPLYRKRFIGWDVVQGHVICEGLLGPHQEEDTLKLACGSSSDRSIRKLL